MLKGIDLEQKQHSEVLQKGSRSEISQPAISFTY